MAATTPKYLGAAPYPQPPTLFPPSHGSPLPRLRHLTVCGRSSTSHCLLASCAFVAPRLAAINNIRYSGVVRIPYEKIPEKPSSYPALPYYLLLSTFYFYFSFSILVGSPIFPFAYTCCFSSLGDRRDSSPCRSRILSTTLVC